LGKVFRVIFTIPKIHQTLAGIESMAFIHEIPIHRRSDLHSL